MNDPAFMGGPQGIRQGNCDFQNLLNGQSLLGDVLIQGPAFDELHGQESDILILFDGIDGDDVGVVERGKNLGLTPKPLEPLGIPRQILRHHL